MHANGKIVAVWLDKDAPIIENEAFYQKVYDLQIDMLTTDFPQNANEALNRYHNQLKNQTNKTKVEQTYAICK